MMLKRILRLRQHLKTEEEREETEEVGDVVRDIIHFLRGGKQKIYASESSQTVLARPYGKGRLEPRCSVRKRR